MSDTKRLTALLRELGPLLETAAFFGLDARWTPEQVAQWLVNRGVRADTPQGEHS